MAETGSNGDSEAATSRSRLRSFFHEHARARCDREGARTGGRDKGWWPIYSTREGWDLFANSTGTKLNIVYISGDYFILVRQTGVKKENNDGVKEEMMTR